MFAAVNVCIYYLFIIVCKCRMSCLWWCAPSLLEWVGVHAFVSACLASFFNVGNWNKGSITQVCGKAHNAASVYKQEVCMAEYGVGTGRRTTSVIYGILLGNWQRRKVVTTAWRASSSGVLQNIGLRWFVSTTYQLGCDDNKLRRTTSSTGTGLVFKSILACFRSSSVLVREPSGAYYSFCWLP